MAYGRNHCALLYSNALQSIAKLKKNLFDKFWLKGWIATFILWCYYNFRWHGLNLIQKQYLVYTHTWSH